MGNPKFRIVTDMSQSQVIIKVNFGRISKKQVISFYIQESFKRIDIINGRDKSTP